MKIIDVIYFYYFQFYVAIIKDPEPHFATVLALGFSFSLLINGTMDIIALKYFCFDINVKFQFAILVVILILIYLSYHKSGRARKIIDSKANFDGKKAISIAFTLIFWLATTSWLFWGPIYGKYLLSLCK